MSPRLTSCRGGALLSAILFTTVLLILAGSALRLVVNERKINARHAFRLQARNIAEAQAEYGITQICFKLDNRTSFPSGLLNPSSADAIVLPPATLFPGISLATADRELVAGTIDAVTDPNSLFYFVDPADPANAFETIKNRRVVRKDVVLLSRVTVNSSIGSPITARVSQRLSLRDIPLFSNAIFYNMDMELSPGPPMDVTGPVHSNGNLNVAVTRNDGGLSFLGPVTASKGLFVGQSLATTNKNGNRTLIGGPGGDTSDYSKESAMQPINFLSPSGVLVNLRNVTPGDTANAAAKRAAFATLVWRDHRMGTATTTEATLNDFRSSASNNYGGNLQTSAHGVPPQNPVAIGDYKPDSDPVDMSDDSVNEARTIIEPPLSASDSGFKPAQEDQKLSRKSGIYIMVNPSAIERNARMPDGTIYPLPARQYRAFRQDGTAIILPGSTVATAGVNHTNPGGREIIKIKPAQMTDVRRTMPGFNEQLPRSAANKYVPRTLDVVDVDITALKLAVERTVKGSSTATIYNYDSATSQSTYKSTTPSSVTIDDSNRIGGFAADDWNGAVYIQSVDAETRKDSGVRLINGRGRLPSAGADTGLSIATNDALYIIGHYNSDGTANTAAASSTPEAGETPAALLADSVTILSQPKFTAGVQNAGWNDQLSGIRHMNAAGESSVNWATTPWANWNQNDGRSDGKIGSNDPLESESSSPALFTPKDVKFLATETIVAAAIVSGVVPNGKNGNIQGNGGAQNLPRYLENWQNATKSIIRGSMVGMFESRVTTEQFSTRVFNPPTRIWGLNSLFAQGFYPPQTPVVRSYTRVDFKEVSEAEYAAIKVAFGW